MIIIIDDLHNSFILIITMMVDWLVIIWWWSWILIVDYAHWFTSLIDYDEKHDWRSIDDWSWMMTDDNDYRWWFIMIDNGRSWMMTDWQTDWLTEWMIDD